IDSPREEPRVEKSTINAAAVPVSLCDELDLQSVPRTANPPLINMAASGRSLCLLRPHSCPPSLLSLRDSFAGGCRESALWMVPSPGGSVAGEPIQSGDCLIESF